MAKLKTQKTDDGKVIIEGYAMAEEMEKGFYRYNRRKPRELAVVLVRTNAGHLPTKRPVLVRVTVEIIQDKTV